MRRKNILQIPLNDLELEAVKGKAESLQLKTTELVRRILEKALKSGKV